MTTIGEVGVLGQQLGDEVEPALRCPAAGRGTRGRTTVRPSASSAAARRGRLDDRGVHRPRGRRAGSWRMFFSSSTTRTAEARHRRRLRRCGRGRARSDWLAPRGRAELAIERQVQRQHVDPRLAEEAELRPSVRPRPAAAPARPRRRGRARRAAPARRRPPATGADRGRCAEAVTSSAGIGAGASGFSLRSRATSAFDAVAQLLRGRPQVRAARRGRVVAVARPPRARPWKYAGLVKRWPISAEPTTCPLASVTRLPAACCGNSTCASAGHAPAGRASPVRTRVTSVACRAITNGRAWRFSSHEMPSGLERRGR